MPDLPESKREYLRQLVAEKNRWNRPLTEIEKQLEFLGWHERGYLPHCDYPGLVQLVTFRLVDSMPSTRRSEWEHLLSIEEVHEKRQRLEEYLDRGHGQCWLRDPRVGALCEEAVMYFHGKRYELRGWCVMPNHVHVLVEIWLVPLWKIVQTWKIRIARESWRFLVERRAPARRRDLRLEQPPSRRSALQWQREYWDTFMRDEEQERRAVRYIDTNPLKAKLCRTPEEWAFSSARFRDDYGRLILPKRLWE